MRSDIPKLAPLPAGLFHFTDLSMLATSRHLPCVRPPKEAESVVVLAAAEGSLDEIGDVGDAIKHSPYDR
jgi:hypothetical protein